MTWPATSNLSPKPNSTSKKLPDTWKTSLMSPNTNKKKCLENSTNSTPPELDSRPNLANKPEPSKRKNNSLPSSPEPRTLLNNPTKNSNELSKRKPKLKPLWPMPSRPVDTTTTCFENSTKKNKKPKL